MRATAGDSGRRTTDGRPTSRAAADPCLRSGVPRVVGTHGAAFSVLAAQALRLDPTVSRARKRRLKGRGWGGGGGCPRWHRSWCHRPAPGGPAGGAGRALPPHWEPQPKVSRVGVGARQNASAVHPHRRQARAQDKPGHRTSPEDAPAMQRRLLWEKKSQAVVTTTRPQEETTPEARHRDPWGPPVSRRTSHWKTSSAAPSSSRDNYERGHASIARRNGPRCIRGGSRNAPNTETAGRHACPKALPAGGARTGR